MTPSLILASIFAPVLISFLISQFAAPGRLRTLRAYFLADHQLRAWHILNLFLSTSLAFGGAIVYFTWLGYKVGYAALILQVCWCVGLWWVSLHATRIRQITGDGTLHGVLGAAYGDKTARLAAIATVVGFTFNLGIETFAIGTLLKTVTSSPVITGAVIVCLALSVAAYTATRGMRGNVIVNQIQNAVSLAALIICVVVVGFTFTGTTTIVDNRSVLGTYELVAFLTVGGLLSSVFLNLVWQIGDMSAWQSIAASTDKEAAAKVGIQWSIGLILLVPGLLPTMLGVLMRQHVAAGSEADLFAGILQIVAQHPALAAIVVAGFVCAMLSTVDGFMLSAAQTIVQDILRRPAQEATELAIARGSVVLLSVLGGAGVFLLAQQESIGVFNLVYLGYTAQIALVAGAYAIIRNRSVGLFGAVSIWAGLLGGFGVVTYSLWHDGATANVAWSPFAAFGLSAVCIVLGMLVSREKVAS